MREGSVLSGKYALEQCIGQGAMGEVYRARNLDIGRTVAVKLLTERHAKDEVAVRRFLREARAATLVQHPNVVDIIDVGQDDHGVPYMVQDYLHGLDLREHLRARGGRLTPTEAVTLLRPIAEALGVAHQRGVVHRDIKPSNIFLATEQGVCVPKLVDFGISRVASPEETATQAGQMVGTPAYMAPEQINSPDSVGSPADVWAFGVVLFESIAGRRPFEAQTIAGLYVAISQMTPPRLDLVAGDTPTELSWIVTRCLSRELDGRFPNGAELAAALGTQALAAALARPAVGGAPSIPAMLAPTAQPAPMTELSVGPFIPMADPLPPLGDLAAAMVPELNIPRRSRPDFGSAPSSSRNLAAVSGPPSSSRNLVAAPARPSGSLPSAAPRADRPSIGGQAPPMSAPSAFDSEPPPGAEIKLDVERASVAWRRAELHGQPRASKPAGRVEPKSSGVLLAIVGAVLDAVVSLAALGALARFVHKPAGISLRVNFPAAVDGTSLKAAAAVALTSIALTVGLGGLALRPPRSYAMLFAAFGALLTAIVMITVAFSTSDPSMPPESAFFVPFVVPALPLGLAAWLVGLGFRQWQSGGGRRALLPLLAALGGALAFLALEVSPATGLLVW